MTTKPKTRKAPAKAVTSKSTPKEMELGANGLPPPSPFHAIIEAEDALGKAKRLVDAIYMMITELNDYECGAICAVADAINDKIDVSLELLDSYTRPGHAAYVLEAKRCLIKAGIMKGEPA